MKSVIQIDESPYFFITTLEDRIPQWNKHFVYLFDLSEKRATNKFQIPVTTTTSTTATVRGNTECVFIMSSGKLFIYSVNLTEDNLIWSTDTFNNDYPILNISQPQPPNYTNTFFVFPSVKEGYLSFAQIEKIDEDRNPNDFRVTIVKEIHAHYSKLMNSAISSDGSLVATASYKGTVIRVYATSGPCDKAFKEFRRGTIQCDIKDMQFSPNNKVLAVVSMNGTCHLFGLVDSIPNRDGYCKIGYDWSSCDVACSASGLSMYKVTFVNDERIVVADSAGKALVADLVFEDGKEIVVSHSEIVDYFN